MAIGGRELELFIRRWYELWNAQDKEGWLGHWRSMSPEAPALEDPVGTPVKRGWELASQLWDATGPDHPTVLIRQLIIGGDEAVVVASNEGTYRGEPLVIPSVDIWHVEPAGASAIRSFWEIPEHIPYGRWTARTGSAR